MGESTHRKMVIESLRVVVIGAGNVASHIAPALQCIGLSISQVYSRSEKSAMQLAATLNIPYTTDLACIEKNADIYLFCIKDDALNDVLGQLQCDTSSLWIHTAGSVDSAVFAPYSNRYGVLYPLQTFSKQKEISFANLPLFIEANNESDTQLIHSIASKLSCKVWDANSEQRKQLHIAATFACNFSNHMFAIAQQLLSKNDFPFEVLLPLIDEMVEKIKKLSPIAAQTGPAVREDFNTINQHISLLEDDNLKNIYTLLSNHIIDYKKL